MSNRDDDVRDVIAQAIHREKYDSMEFEQLSDALQDHYRWKADPIVAALHRAGHLRTPGTVEVSRDVHELGIRAMKFQSERCGGGDGNELNAWPGWIAAAERALDAGADGE